MDSVRIKRGENIKIRSPQGRVIIPESQVSERGTVASVTLCGTGVQAPLMRLCLQRAGAWKLAEFRGRI